MSASHSGTGYEQSDANARKVVLIGIVLVLLLAASLAASAWISRTLQADAAGERELNPMRTLRKAPAGPELQSLPSRELELQRAWEEELLLGTAWVDPVNRVVRIPIERAMELCLQEGFPVRETRVNK